MRKSKRLETQFDSLELLQSRDGLSPRGDYFISSFYKTVERSKLIHAKNHSVNNNPSQKSLKSSHQKSKPSSNMLHKTVTKEALQFYSKKNKLNMIFDDPQTRQSLTLKKTPIEENYDEKNIMYFSRSQAKTPMVKTKPARFSLQILAKKSEKFQGLLNKFAFGLKVPQPQTNYLKKEINNFFQKTKYNQEKQTTPTSSNAPITKYMDFIQKFPQIRSLQKQKTSYEEFQNLMNSSKINKKKVSFDCETYEDFKRLMNGQIADQPLNLETLFKPTSEKKAIKEMVKIKNEELKRPSKNPNHLKVDTNPVHAKDHEIDEIISGSPLLGHHRNIAEQHRPLIKRSFASVRKALKEALNYLASLKLSIPDLMNNCVFSKKPYQKEGSYELIKACKRGEKDKVKKLLELNRFLVYDFDDVYMTALHWATRRGHIDICVLLIKKGTDLNAKDIIGRTPLYIALQCSRTDIIKILLYQGANPWSSIQVNYKRVMKPNKLGTTLVTKARKLHILMKMTPAHLRQALWQRESWLVFLEGGGEDLFKKFHEKPHEN